MTDAAALVPLESHYPQDRDPARVYLARLARGSRRSMESALARVAAILAPGVPAGRFPWPLVRYQHTQAVRAALVDLYAPATVNRHLCALRGALGEAWRLGQMDAEAYHRAVAVKSVRGSRLPAGRALTQRELNRLFGACGERGASGARNAALLTLLYAAGLRRAEAVALSMEDYNQETGELRILGKGNQERIAHATNGAKLTLDRWLEVRGPAAGPLLCPVTKGGTVIAGHSMTGESVRDAMARLAKWAGVQPFTPHDLRRTCITHLLEKGVDLAIVQRIAGHKSIQTTARYDLRGEKAKRDAAQLLHVPFAA